MYISKVDISYGRVENEKAKHRRKQVDEIAEQPNTSGVNSSALQETESFLMPTKLRKRKFIPVYRKDDEFNESDEELIEDEEYKPSENTGGKKYKKVRIYSVSEESCVLADRRMTSIRQQSDQLTSLVDRGSISASPATIHRRREAVRMKSMTLSEAKLDAAPALQLCYDGRIVNKIDRYVVLGQFIDDTQSGCESVMHVKSFPKDMAVTAEAVFCTIKEEINIKYLKKVHSIMADTTALNTGKFSGVNQRLTEYFNEDIGHDIHTLECLFHVNEIYLTHVISMTEGKRKGPGSLESGALLNSIPSIEKPRIENLVPREQFDISITPIAAVHLKAKLEWFSQQKQKGTVDNSFRSDQVCMLVLACYIITDIPENLKNLLLYKQERICHSRWITTANGYLRTLLLNVGNLSTDQKMKLQKIVSYILCVYVPSFLMIHLNPRVPEGPFLNLFQRDLLFAFRQIEPAVANVAMKYFLEHASKWLSWKNVALSVYSEVPPYTTEAIKTSRSFPQSVDVRLFLQDPTKKLKHFFTWKSKDAPCITASHIHPSFWKSIDNNNRSTERRIGKLKGLIQERISEKPSQLNRSDIRLRAFLCNMES